MSSLRFTQAPPRPDHIPGDVWDKEWIDLWVGLASIFPVTIGYLGEGKARIWDKKTHLYREPTAAESMNFVAEKLMSPMWISRSALIHACKYSTPRREVILAWLEEESQKGREMFAVPDTVAEYIP